MSTSEMMSWLLLLNAVEWKLVCKFIRINTSNEKRGYDTDYEVSKIQTFISKFKEKKIKENENKIKELEDEIKKIKTLINKSKCISCQKCFSKLQTMKNTQWEIKPIKIGEQPGTKHCLGCKGFTHNFRS